jgi:hypothetical protein
MLTLLALLDPCCSARMVLGNHIAGSTSSSLYVDAADNVEASSAGSAGGSVEVRRIVLRKVSWLSSLLIIEAMMSDSMVCKGVRTNTNC